MGRLRILARHPVPNITVFLSESSLPHLLSSDSYCNEDHYLAERASVFLASWHLVATEDELRCDGDFVTRFVAGVPVQVRNFSGQIRALSNVCAHRHALICAQSNGNSPTMRCQYHGWEYRSDGCTGKIPQPKNFVPFEKESMRLPVYETEWVGKLLFVNVSANPRPIVEEFGEDALAKLASHFGEGWGLAMSRQHTFAVNWKIPVEIALESYHVPMVHAKTFREDPGSDRSMHEVHPTFTSLKTQLPFARQHWLDSAFQRLESSYLQWQGHVPSQQYEHVHLFPNLLVSFTDTVSLIQCVEPSGPRDCNILTYQFGRLPSRNRGIRRKAAWIWNQFAAKLTRRILVEDQDLYQQIQAGLNESPHAGVLGICEERIYHFQKRLLERMEAAAAGKEKG